MQKKFSITSIVSVLAIALALITAGLISTTSPVSAIGNARIFWVYSNGAYGQNRIQLANEAATLTPTAITPATAAGYTARTIATDGTYLYFVDNSDASIVRTDLSGANRTLVVAATGVQQVVVQNGTLYFVDWNNGVYSVPASGGSSTRIIAPSFITATCTTANGGWGGIQVTADNLFFSWYNGSPGDSACYGVYKSARSGASFATPTKLAAPTGGWTTAGWLQLDGNDLYLSMASNSFDKTSDYSTWTRYSVSPGSFSLQALYVYGSTVYMTSNLGSVYTMPKTDTSGSSITRLFTNAASSYGYQILALPPPTYTITYTNGGGTGTDLVQTIAQGSSLTLPSPTACPASANDPCFTSPSGQRPNNWQVTSGTLSSGSSYPMTGQSVTPTSNVTLAARWTGGPVQYSTTSFTSGGTAMTSIPFPDTAVGASNQITVYAYNSGTASTSISNETVGGSGVTRQGGTCNASGGTIAAGAQCTLILQWNPSIAGTLNAGSYSMQVAGPYNDAVTLMGTAAANKTVTFNYNGGSGTMSNQVAAFPTNLVANAFTRTGYSFSYWTLFSDGSGTQYVNQASYSFTNNATMFANWSADSHVVTFNTDGGSAVANGSFNTDGSMNLPTAPTKAGYTFNGWFAAPTGGTALSSPYSPPGTSAITLYAQWSVDNSGGSGSNGNLPYTGNQTGQILGISGALLSIGLAITAFAMYRRRKA